MKDITKEIGERYFLFKRVKGDYYTIDLNTIWDDVFEYLLESPYKTYCDEDLIHISILHRRGEEDFLDVGFLFSDYIPPCSLFRVNVIQSGFFKIVKQVGLNNNYASNSTSFFYMKHLNSTDTIPINAISTEIYVLQ